MSIPDSRFAQTASLEARMPLVDVDRRKARK
jgi:hypothetical protein